MSNNDRVPEFICSCGLFFQNTAQSTCGITTSYAFYIPSANVQPNNASIIQECFHRALNEGRTDLLLHCGDPKTGLKSLPILTE